MKENNMAANEMSFANSYNLQLFNDDYLETPIPTEGTTVETTKTPVETAEEIEVQESTPEEIQEEPKQEEPKQKDITQTQAFAKRLKEETERARQEARDSYIAEQGYVWNGKTIRTEAEYKQAMYEKSLHDAGLDAETINKLVDEHPDVKRSREEREAAQKNEALFNQWIELTTDYPEIKDFADIPDDVYKLANDKNIPLLDAYNRTQVKNQKAQIEKVKLETEQETIKKIQKNATTSPGSALDNGVVHKNKSVDEMTSEEFAAYREEVRKQRRD